MLTTFDSRVFRVGRRVDVQYDVWLLLLFRWLGIRWVLWMVDGSCGWSEEIRWVELRFSPSRDPICPSYPIIAWDEADSRGSLRNIAVHQLQLQSKARLRYYARERSRCREDLRVGGANSAAPR